MSDDKRLLMVDDDDMRKHGVVATGNATFAVGIAALMLAASRKPKHPRPKKLQRLIDHEHRIAWWKSAGGRTLWIAPHCGCPAFEEESPPLRGGIWTSMLTCPRCGFEFQCHRTPNRYTISQRSPIVNQDLFTADEIQRAKDIIATSRDTPQISQRIHDEIITDEVMARINKGTGQENDRKYMAYRLEYVAS